MRWGRDLATAPPLIAVDESPDWVFLAGCSPAEPASASPAGAIMPVINLARQCFSSERRNVAYPVVSAQGSTPVRTPKGNFLLHFRIRTETVHPHQLFRHKNSKRPPLLHRLQRLFRFLLCSPVTEQLLAFL